MSTCRERVTTLTKVGATLTEKVMAFHEGFERPLEVLTDYDTAEGPTAAAAVTLADDSTGEQIETAAPSARKTQKSVDWIPVKQK